MITKSKTPGLHRPDVSNVQSNIGHPIVCKSKDTHKVFLNLTREQIFVMLASSGKFKVYYLKCDEATKVNNNLSIT